MRDNSGNFLKLSFCILVLHPGFQVSAVSPYIGKTAMCGNVFTACRRVFFPVSDSGLNPEPVQFLIKGTETFFHDNGYIFPVALYRICQFADFQVRIQVKPVALSQSARIFASSSSLASTDSRLLPLPRSDSTVSIFSAMSSSVSSTTSRYSFRCGCNIRIKSTMCMTEMTSWNHML